MDITPLGAGTAPKRDLAQASAAAIDPAKAKADADAQKAAEAFEANFIGEMLKESGVNSVSDSFGGGAGEEAFSSFLTQEYAKKVAENGGLGLAEHIFEAIKQRGSGA